MQALCGAPTQLNDTVAIVLNPVDNPQGRIAGHLPIKVPKQVWTYNPSL
jgi:hypothetical protein